MSVIEISPVLEAWLERAVFPSFQNRGIHVTQAAKTLIAFTIQAQGEEETLAVPHLRQELSILEQSVRNETSAQGTFFENAAGLYLEIYRPGSTLNVNRAVRLMAEIYFRRFGKFPCGPTGGSESGGSSSGGGRGEKSKVGAGSAHTPVEA